MMISCEQQARDILERMEIEGAQNFTAGDLVEIANLISDKSCLIHALKEIAEGKGRYSLVPLEHASNTIDDMKELANNAIAALDQTRQEPCEHTFPLRKFGASQGACMKCGERIPERQEQPHTFMPYSTEPSLSKTCQVCKHLQSHPLHISADAGQEPK